MRYSLLLYCHPWFLYTYIGRLGLGILTLSSVFLESQRKKSPTEIKLLLSLYSLLLGSLLLEQAFCISEGS